MQCSTNAIGAFAVLLGSWQGNAMERKMRRISGILLAAAMLIAAARVDAAVPYRRLYAFGDSYSDTGAGYASSNGPSAVAHLAQRLGVVFTHSKDPRANGQGINFAVAGAATGAHPGREIGGHWLAVGMQDQVEDFVARVRRGEVRFDPDTTLFFIAGGLNDVGVPTQDTLGNLTRQVELLKSVGARHVSLALLPTRVPAFSAEGRRLNPAYRRLVPALRRKLGIDLRLNRYGAYMDDVLAHPKRYGIANTGARCAPNPLFGQQGDLCATPERYFYYYENHPSAVVNRIVGDRLYAEIVGAAAQPASRSQRAASSAK